MSDYKDSSGIDLSAKYRCVESRDECSGVALGKTFLGNELLPIFMKVEGQVEIVARKCPYCRAQVEKVPGE